MTKQHLPCGQYEPLPGKIHRLVGWQHGDVDGLKVHPHRRSWICQPAMREGVGGKQETEVVRHKRQRYGKQRKKRQPQADRANAHHRRGQPFPACQRLEEFLYACEQAVAKPRPCECECKRDQSEAELEFEQSHRPGISSCFQARHSLGRRSEISRLARHKKMRAGCS